MIFYPLPRRHHDAEPLLIVLSNNEIRRGGYFPSRISTVFERNLYLCSQNAATNINQRMKGVNGPTMNDMMSACTNMMTSFQNP